MILLSNLHSELKNCEQCHTTKKWDYLKPDIKFEHSITGFNLGGTHAKIDCSKCHTFKNSIKHKKDCSDCHKNPHKKDITKQGDCKNCHKDTYWVEKTKKHEEFANGFVLEGSHKTLHCSKCHKTSKYSDASPECISCHLKDYKKTKNPNHKTLNFSTDCNSCHTPYLWNQGRYYQHETYFPILSGDHSGYSCVTCHKNSSNYKDVTCTDCHKKNRTDKEHRKVSGYTFSSSACISCHPRGK